jgi:hypothetical protein
MHLSQSFTGCLGGTKQTEQVSVVCATASWPPKPRATGIKVTAEEMEHFIATTDRRMTADEIKAELLTLRQRMFDGRRVEDIQRLGRVAKNLVLRLKEAEAEIPKASSKTGPRTKAAHA